MKRNDNQPTGIQPTGHFKNPADAATLADMDKRLGLSETATEAERVAARRAFLESDDDVPGEVTAGGEEEHAEVADPDGDGDPDAGAAEEVHADAAENDEGTPPAEEETETPPAEEPPAKPPAAEAPPAVEPPAAPAPHAQAEEEDQPVLHKTRSPEDLKADRIELVKKKADAFKKYSDGDLSAEDYMAIDTEVSDGLAAIASEVTLIRANESTLLAHSQRALDAVRAEAATEGLVDYSKPENQQVFDTAVQALQASPAAAKLSNREFYRRCHVMAKGMLGIVDQPKAAAPAAAAPAPGKPAAAAPRTPPPVPPTLRNLPAASQPHTGGGVTEELTRLADSNPLAFQAKVGAMSKAQREAFMDS